jgi:hypothetical protein
VGLDSLVAMWHPMLGGAGYKLSLSGIIRNKSASEALTRIVCSATLTLNFSGKPARSFTVGDFCGNPLLEPLSSREEGPENT